MNEEAIEAALAERFGDTLADDVPLQRYKNIEWLHVISEAYAHGGHTRLLEMLLFAQTRAQKQTGVVITRSATTKFCERVEDSGASLHILRGSLAHRARDLLSIGRTAQRIVLHIHPDDAVAALAARRLRSEGYKVLFVNHADHCFSYGPGAADICLEISGFGSRLSKARRRISAQHFLGIPIEASETSVITSKPSLRASLFSMGSSTKYEPGNGYDFPAFVCDLLDQANTNIEIIGPSPSDPWWAAALNRHGDRIRLLGYLPFKEASARLATASAYIDSFPMNGGTAFPQALVAGKVVFGFGPDHGGYSLADTLRYPNLEAMTNALVTFLRTGTAPRKQNEVRFHILKDFNADIIATRLEDAAEGNLTQVPLDLTNTCRSLNYHSEIWRAKGKLNFRLSKLEHLSLRLRLKIFWVCRKAPKELLNAPSYKKLTLALLRGSP